MVEGIIDEEGKFIPYPKLLEPPKQPQLEPTEGWVQPADIRRGLITDIDLKAEGIIDEEGKFIPYPKLLEPPISTSLAEAPSGFDPIWAPSDEARLDAALNARVLRRVKFKLKRVTVELPYSIPLRAPDKLDR